MGFNERMAELAGLEWSYVKPRIDEFCTILETKPGGKKEAAEIKKRYTQEKWTKMPEEEQKELMKQINAFLEEHEKAQPDPLKNALKKHKPGKKRSGI